MNVTRRNFLKLGAMAGAGLALPLGTLAVPINRMIASAATTSPGVKPFSVPLPVPPVLKPVRTSATTDYYEITQKAAKQEILPGMKTEVWGFNGIYPGPIFEARSGRKLVVRNRNELPVPVSTHLHGGVTPHDSDGYPTDLILSKGGGSSSQRKHSGDPAWSFHEGSRDYTYPNEQRAMTLWYHDHRMDFTGPQNYRGLAGMYIIRDEVEDELPLPGGDKEVPLIIADRTFKEDGSFYYASIDPSLEEPGMLATAMNGMFGDTVLVNGAPWPVMEVSNTKYRFRILNASNARLYDLALDPPPEGGKPFVQVGSDGGLLEAPISHDHVLTSPAERFDVVADFSRYPVGTEVTMKNLEGEGKTRDVMRFVVARKEKEKSTVPKKLAPELDFPDPSDAEITRRFKFLSGAVGAVSTINNKLFDPKRIDANPRLNDTEVWHLRADSQYHPVHLHLVHFKVLSRNGGPPGPYDAGWKDTVLLRKEDNVRVVAKFEGYKGKYVFHCHILEHEDMMMMANFEVV